MNLLGLLFITISVFGGTIKGFCGKNLGTYAHSVTDSAKLNCIRMIFCTIVSLIVICFQGNLNHITSVTTVTLIIASFASVFTCIFIISWLMSVRGSAYMLVSVFLNLGVIVPIFLSAIFFGQTITLKEIIGIVILLVAIWLMLGYNKSLNGGFTLKDFLLLLVCGVANGLCDFLVGSTEKLGNILNTTFSLESAHVDDTAFNFYMYIFSFILLLGYTFFSSKTTHKAQIKIDKKIIVYLVIMAIFLFVNTYFKSLAGRLLTSTQLFSINTGGSLVLASIMASIMFKEKPTVKSTIGIVLTFVSLIFLK